MPSRLKLLRVALLASLALLVPVHGFVPLRSSSVLGQHRTSTDRETNNGAKLYAATIGDMRESSSSASLPTESVKMPKGSSNAWEVSEKDISF